MYENDAPGEEKIMESTQLPTSYVYVVDNGRLKSFPRYGVGHGDEALPGEYALVYTKSTGTPSKKESTIKVFIIKNNGHIIKEFKSSIYNNIPKYHREAVEKYIFDQLSNPQQSILSFRKRKTKAKVKSKRK